jgi:hypothetical protein
MCEIILEDENPIRMAYIPPRLNPRTMTISAPEDANESKNCLSALSSTNSRRES